MPDFPLCNRCKSPVYIDPAEVTPGCVVLHAACNAFAHALAAERLGLDDHLMPRRPIRWLASNSGARFVIDEDDPPGGGEEVPLA